MQANDNTVKCQMCNRNPVVNPAGTVEEAGLCAICIRLYRGDAGEVETPPRHLAKETLDTECMICSDELDRSPGAVIYQCFTCKSEFHPICMDRWTAQRVSDGRDGNCPYCARTAFNLQDRRNPPPPPPPPTLT